MTTNKTTPVTVMRNDGPAETQVDPKAKRTPVELPKIDVVGAAKGIAFSTVSGPGRPKVANPFADHVRNANSNRDSILVVRNITTPEQANKVKSLLARAASENTVEKDGVMVPACSIRAEYQPTDNRVIFQAVDRITRTRSAESQARTDG